MAKTILVVDDSKSIRDIMRMTLQFKGYSVLEAEDGDEAYDMLKEKECDLVITDIAMPNMSGTELLKKIRGELKLTVPVIICSAEKSISEESFLQHGANKLLIKPVPPHTLLELVEGLL